jgi:hypothetical protein
VISILARSEPDLARANAFMKYDGIEERSVPPLIQLEGRPKDYLVETAAASFYSTAA